MGRVLTNNISLAYSVEPTLGTAGAAWQTLEPNTISTFGAEISTVSRDPISKDRQRRKGTVTDLDSSIEFEHDLSMTSFEDFIEGFGFANAVNGNMTFPVTAVSNDGEFTVAALTASQASPIKSVNDQYATLFYGRGFSQPGNNGLWYAEDTALATHEQIDAQAISNVTAFTAETDSNGIIELAGVRFLAGSGNPTLSYSSNRLTITGTAQGFDWGDFRVTPGQAVAIGAVQSNGHPSFRGYGRVVSAAGHVMVLDKVSESLKTQSPITDDMDVYFGKFVRNVAVDHADYLERSFQFELDFPGLGDGNTPGYQYAIGNYCNTMAFNVPLADKATITFGFVGTDTENPTTTRKTGAANATKQLKTEVFNTTADIARLRVQEADEDGITTDFKSLTMTLNNNVTPEKVLGTLGAKFMNTGNFEVDIEAQMLFTNSRVVDKIRDNETVTMDFVLKNGDGAIAVDVPSMTLSGGGREFPVNETVLINTTAMAFQDPTLGSSIGVSVFPFIPN